MCTLNLQTKNSLHGGGSLLRLDQLLGVVDCGNLS